MHSGTYLGKLAQKIKEGSRKPYKEYRWWTGPIEKGLSVEKEVFIELIIEKKG